MQNKNDESIAYHANLTSKIIQEGNNYKVLVHRLGLQQMAYMVPLQTNPILNQLESHIEASFHELVHYLLHQ